MVSLPDKSNKAPAREAPQPSVQIRAILAIAINVCKLVYSPAFTSELTYTLTYKLTYKLTHKLTYKLTYKLCLTGAINGLVN